jgi:hypothetical protein
MIATKKKRNNTSVELQLLETAVRMNARVATMLLNVIPKLAPEVEQPIKVPPQHESGIRQALGFLGLSDQPTTAQIREAVVRGIERSHRAGNHAASMAYAYVGMALLAAKLAS